MRVAQEVSVNVELAQRVSATYEGKKGNSMPLERDTQEWKTYQTHHDLKSFESKDLSGGRDKGQLDNGNLCYRSHHNHIIHLCQPPLYDSAVV